ncbi:Alcohol dehydrogenase [NADP(+)] A [Holothuria leucospilota]|uniref:Alcohol dehydrogenase [NADP(+)] A n=1 Tax=Holothuria leucospilota TaxID=206669 RepID=A0A9Q1H904_HOLLE|nr:Alcohol dehydrogenase [NADP(+)] A [Holothuria leucospilota]
MAFWPLSYHSPLDVPFQTVHRISKVGLIRAPLTHVRCSNVLWMCHRDPKEEEDRICLANWHGSLLSEPAKVTTAVKSAIDVGYRHIDCAYCYDNEDAVGDAIQSKIADGTVNREQLFVTSKQLFETFHKAEDVETGVKNSLTSLKLEYLDLYLMHWPFGITNTGERWPTGPDGKALYNDVHFTETWQAMEKLVEKGLVRSIGLSNFNISQIKEVIALPNKVPIANNQVELSPYLVQGELIDFCKSHNITVTAYSPLGSPDREDPLEGEPVLMEHPKLVELAKRKGKSVAQILIRYHLQQNVVCIPKSVTPSRIQENFESLNFELSDAEIQEMKSFNRNHRYCTYGEASEHPLYPFGEKKM